MAIRANTLSWIFGIAIFTQSRLSSEYRVSDSAATLLGP